VLIEASDEESDETSAVWVRDEDRTAEGREEFERFIAEPQHVRYANAVAEAEKRQQAEVERKLEVQRQSVRLSGKWQGARLPPAGGPRPVFIITVIVVSMLATAITLDVSTPQGKTNAIFESLAFVDWADYTAADKNPFASVAHGEVWRLLTPIFLHLSLRHILFNSIMFYLFGRQIEWERGPYFLAAFVLVVGIAANVGQALFPLIAGEYAQFGGLSGVVYGIFGYIWICSRTGQGNYFIPDLLVIIMLAMFMLSWLGEFGVISETTKTANWNHTFGLLAGMTWAMRGAK
jgi:GlpG protein